MTEFDKDYAQSALNLKHLRQKRLGTLAQQVHDGKLSLTAYREEEKRFIAEFASV